MNNFKRFAIFALNSTPEKESYALEWLESQGLNYKEVVGSYKGTLENAYVVVVDDDNKLELIRKLATDFDQESILIVNEDRKAQLEFLKDSQVEKIGQWVSVEPEQIKDLENWTLDGVDYYSVV